MATLVILHPKLAIEYRFLYKFNLYIPPEKGVFDRYFKRKEAKIMSGELSVNVKSVRSDPYFVRPWNDCNASNDLTMVLGNNEFLHICGNNDWAFLALELLTPIKDEAKKIMKLVKDRKSESPKLKAVMLGKNDKRIMDVYFGGKDKCDRLFGLPILTTEHLNEVSFLIEDTHELPFY